MSYYSSSKVSMSEESSGYVSKGKEPLREETSAPAAAAAAAAAAPPAESGPTVSIIVKLPSGRAVPLTIGQSSTVNTLRQRIAGLAPELGVPARRLILLVSGKPLDQGNATLSDSLIENETKVTVQVAEPPPRGPEFDVIIKLSSGRSGTQKIAATDDIRELRRKVAGSEDIGDPSRVTLKFKGAELRDGTTCDEIGLTQECILQATIKEPPPAAAAAASAESATVTEEERARVLNNFATGAKSKKVEVVFCFDTTGSMYSCLDAVRSNISQTATRLFKEIPGIRIGIIAIGDYCDAITNYVVKSVDLTSDAEAICKFVRDVKATSGGDTPEAYEWALREARGLQWSDDASKALVMIGDSPPHPPSYTTENIWWKDELDALASRGIKVYGVQALFQQLSEPFYREMATRTGAIYIKFANFNLITDMFLAVCYRESAATKLTQYVEEVKQEGRMTDELAKVMDTLAKPNEEKKTQEEIKAAAERPPEYPYDWWDKRNDHGHSPSYMRKLGAWMPYYGAVSSWCVIC